MKALFGCTTGYGRVLAELEMVPSRGIPPRYMTDCGRALAALVRPLWDVRTRDRSSEERAKLPFGTRGRGRGRGHA